MPGNGDLLIVGVFAKQFGGPDQDIRAQDAFHGIQHPAMDRQFVGPAKMQMHLPHFHRAWFSPSRTSNPSVSLRNRRTSSLDSTGMGNRRPS